MNDIDRIARQNSRDTDRILLKQFEDDVRNATTERERKLAQAAVDETRQRLRKI